MHATRAFRSFLALVSSFFFFFKAEINSCGNMQKENKHSETKLITHCKLVEKNQYTSLFMHCIKKHLSWKKSPPN